MKKVLSLLFLQISILLLFSPPLLAATIVVGSDGTDKLGDVPDGAADGVCQLREAIVNANDNAVTHVDCTAGTDDTDIIELQDGVTYNLELLGSAEDLSATGDLDIAEGLTLTSNGIATIDAGPLASDPDRVLQYAGIQAFTLSHLILRGGQINANLADNFGAALYISSNTDITIDDCEFLENTIDLSGNNIIYGGVIGSETLNSITITDSNFQNNTVIGNPLNTTSLLGGVLYFYGFSSVSIGRSQFTSNTISNYGMLAGGLAYFNNIASSASATITDSTFSQNSVTSHNSGVDFGGVLKADNTSLFITNSGLDQNTLYNDSAGSELGGALYFASDLLFSDELVLLNTTIANNSLTSDSGITQGTVYIGGLQTNAAISYSTIAFNAVGDELTTTAVGGGIYIDLDNADDSSLDLKSNILSNNSAIQNSGMGSGQNCYIDDGRLITTSHGYNVIDTISGCVLDITFDDIIEDPELQTLEDWGGYANSFAILPSSVAHDVDADCTDVQGDSVVFDQRGAVRFDGNCDSGAYEYSLFYTDADADTYGDANDTGTTTYSSDASLNNEDCDDTDLNIHPGEDELCDDLDNDCDGDVDEDFAADIGVACAVGDVDCNNGIIACSEDFLGITCVVDETVDCDAGDDITTTGDDDDDSGDDDPITSGDDDDSDDDGLPDSEAASSGSCQLSARAAPSPTSFLLVLGCIMICLTFMRNAAVQGESRLFF